MISVTLTEIVAAGSAKPRLGKEQQESAAARARGAFYAHRTYKAPRTTGAAEPFAALPSRSAIDPDADCLPMFKPVGAARVMIGYPPGIWSG
jgi:hypothetical protein